MIGISEEEGAMMNGMTDGWMMGGTGLVGLLLIVLLILGIAALAKYLFQR